MNIEKLTDLIGDFYNLTGIKTCIYDADENEICFYPQKYSTFCSALRKNKKMEEQCIDCDKKAFKKCRTTYEQYTYKCHAGLIECVSPIIFNEEIIGYIVIGQIKNENSRYADTCETLIENSENLKKEYESLPIISTEKLNSAINILDACAGYEYLKTLVKNENERTYLKIAKYVRKNLATNLSVSALCSVFRLSHDEIYTLFRDFFGLTPAEYVKKNRLNYACKILSTTNISINEIAAKCGIPDYNYFSKIFKKEFGISPREYRKSNHLRYKT